MLGSKNRKTTVSFLPKKIFQKVGEQKVGGQLSCGKGSESTYTWILADFAQNPHIRGYRSTYTWTTLFFLSTYMWILAVCFVCSHTCPNCHPEDHVTVNSRKQYIGHAPHRFRVLRKHKGARRETVGIHIYVDNDRLLYVGERSDRRYPHSHRFAVPCDVFKNCKGREQGVGAKEAFVVRTYKLD